MAVSKQASLGEKPASSEEAAAGEATSEDGGPESKHHSLLLELLAAELGAAPEQIVDFELNVCDTQAGVIGGVQQYFTL